MEDEVSVLKNVFYIAVGMIVILFSIGMFGRLTFPPEGIRWISMLVMLIFFVGMWDRISLWTKGEDEDGEIVSGLGVWGFISLSLSKFHSPDCLFAKRVFARRKRRGIVLLMIVWGFMILFLGEILKTLQEYLPWRFLTGNTFLVFSLVMDIAGGMLLLGLFSAILRRNLKPSRVLFGIDDGRVVKRERTERIVTKFDDSIALWLLSVIVILGFMVEGLNLASFNPSTIGWSPIGAIFASLMKAVIGTNVVSLQTAWRYVYIMHYSSVFLFILYLPYSKMFHMFASQITTQAALGRKSEVIR